MSTNLLQQPTWRIIDQSSQGLLTSALDSFAMDDTLCHSVGKGESPAVARSWVHRSTVVLGIQDSKLPNLQEGIRYLQSLGYDVIVRNSGGLAVVLDEGVLNISLIFPDSEKGIDIDRGYEAMYELVKLMSRQFGESIDAGEIVGSYCPGSYDLSIAGKKFAGISQRRMRNGVAVQIYLCLNGDGAARAAHIKEFYHIALQGEETKFIYPSIDPTTMASLSELFGEDISVPKTMLYLLQTLKNESDSIFTSQLSVDELEIFKQNLERIHERNQKAVVNA